MGWLTGCLIFLCTACNSNSNNYNTGTTTKQDSLKAVQQITNALLKIDTAKKTVATGDLVLRTGNDFTSESLRSLNQRDKTYSHCGIASIENDTVFVYHALGGEFNPDQRICRDRFEDFAAPQGNRGIGIYRYGLTAAEIKSLVITVKNLHAMGIMFDMKFDLQTNDHMYCAEFVYKSYLMGTNGKLQFNTSHIGDFAFIGVDDLFLQPLCTVQKKILYQ
ncbi:YiiX/YebB-like N1pC/P60 family cysteine hydrolase [Ferruginibacter sp.]|nr:hypothetical protein [Ferruginibacter sp.]